MSVPPEVIDVVRRWVQKGEHDLVAATRIFGIEEGCPHMQWRPDTPMIGATPDARRHSKRF
jgi:hypothetical protein